MRILTSIFALALVMGVTGYASAAVLYQVDGVPVNPQPVNECADPVGQSNCLGHPTPERDFDLSKDVE